MYSYSLQLFSVSFLILGRTDRDMIKINIGLHVKYPLILSDFNKILIISTDFSKIFKCKISYISVQWMRWAGHVARMGEERGCIGLAGETGGKETTGET